MPNEINWLAYRAEVAKLMLPVIYKGVDRSAGHQLRSAVDTAIDDTIEIAIEMAERLERRLKKGETR
jgi:hypothetical protein